MAVCKWCQSEVHPEARFCPHCNQPLRGVRTATGILIIAFVVIALMCIGVLMKAYGVL